MAQRRRPFPINSTLGSTLDQGEINDDAARRQQAINEAAAQSYEAWRQKTYGAPNTLQNQAAQSVQDTQQNTQNLVAAKTSQALSAATGFGVAQPQRDTWNPQTQQYERPDTIAVKDQWDPNTGRYTRVAQPGYRSVQPTQQQLQENFAELPTPQQAKIIQSGQAPWVDPASAAKIVGSQQEDREKAVKSGVQKISDMLASGDAQFDPATRTFYSYQLDPENPESGLKKKVPFSPIQVAYTQEGMKRGLIPDIDQFSKPPSSNTAPSDLVNVANDLSPGSSAITTPNSGATVAQLMSQLASTKTSVPYNPANAAGDSSSTMALSPTLQPSSMQLGTNYAYKGTMGIPNDPTQMTPAMDRTGSSLPVARGSVPDAADASTQAGLNAATTLGNLGRQWSSGATNLGAQLPTDLVNFGKGIYNTAANTSNSAWNFVNGLTGSNLPTVPTVAYSPDAPSNGVFVNPISTVAADSQPAPGQDAQDAAMRTSMAALLAKRRQQPIIDDQSLVSY